MGLRPPGEGGVRQETLVVLGEEPGDLPSLAVEVAQQLAGEVHHPQAGVVVADIHDLFLPVHPEVVGAGVGELEPGHFLRVVRVGEVHEVEPALGAGGDALPPEDAAGVGPPGVQVEGFVPADHIEPAGRRAAEGPDRVVPAGDLREPADLHRGVRAAAEAAAPHIHQDQAVGAPGLVGDPVAHPDIVHGAAGGVGLEPGDPERVPRVLHIHHIPPPAVVHRVHMVLVEEHIVDTPGEPLVETRQDLHFARVRHIEQDEAVPPVGRALPAEDAERPVGGDLHIVHGAGVHLDRVDEFHVPGVGHIVEIGVSFGVPGAVDRVVAPVRALPDPKIGGYAVGDPGVAEELHFAADSPRHGAHRAPGDPVAAHGDHRVEARLLGHEPAVGGDLRGSAGAERLRPVGVGPGFEGEPDRRAGQGCAVGVPRLRPEPQHIAGADFGLLRGFEDEPRGRVLPDANRLRDAQPAARGGDDDLAGGEEGHDAEFVHFCDRRIAHRVLGLDRRPEVARAVPTGDGQRSRRPGPGLRRRVVEEEFRDRRRGNGDGHRRANPRIAAAVGVPGAVERSVGQERGGAVLTGAVRRDEAGRRHRERQPVPGEEHHPRFGDFLPVGPEHRGGELARLADFERQLRRLHHEAGRGVLRGRRRGGESGEGQREGRREGGAGQERRCVHASFSSVPARFPAGIRSLLRRRFAARTPFRRA